MPIIATAAWSIPQNVRARFPDEGTALSRYAAVFKGVEINSTFYRRHKPDTFARWAASVPTDFRFAVKIPKEITHVLRLENIPDAFSDFLSQISPLAEKLGPLLCQLPPSLAFERQICALALETMRDSHAGPIVLEARHASWASDEALSVLDRSGIDRVLADPALVWQAGDFVRPPLYIRLHGKPKVYYSSYDEQALRFFAGQLAPDSWCVFDNTASGAAIENALSMMRLTGADADDLAPSSAA